MVVCGEGIVTIFPTKSESHEPLNILRPPGLCPARPRAQRQGPAEAGVLSFLHPLLGPSGWGWGSLWRTEGQGFQMDPLLWAEPKAALMGAGSTLGPQIKAGHPQPSGFLLLVPLSIFLAPTVSLVTWMAAPEQGQSWVLPSSRATTRIKCGVSAPVSGRPRAGLSPSPPAVASGCFEHHWVLPLPGAQSWRHQEPKLASGRASTFLEPLFPSVK